MTSGIDFRVVRGRDLERVCLLEDASVALLRPVGIYKAPGLPRFSFASLSLLFSHLFHLSHRPALLNDLMKPACFIVILQPCIALRRISGNTPSANPTRSWSGLTYCNIASACRHICLPTRLDCNVTLGLMPTASIHVLSLDVIGLTSSSSSARSIGVIT